MKNLELEITQINSKKELNLAFKRIEELLSKDEQALTKNEENELNIISLLVEQYENINYPLDIIDPIDLLKELMEEREWKTKDLANLIGNKTLASLILNKKRSLSIKVMKGLHQEFQIPYEILMLASDLKNDISA